MSQPEREGEKGDRPLKGRPIQSKAKCPWEAEGALRPGTPTRLAADTGPVCSEGEPPRRTATDAHRGDSCREATAPCDFPRH